jgi:DMSO/TMAO reductase YedYZ molybdopterin-dependent catalytic subunit
MAQSLRVGLLAGLVLVGVMELAGWAGAIRPLPDVLQAPILAAMPGVVFGFLIDTLQHAGKVIEEAGLLVLMLAGLAGLGAAAGIGRERGLPWAGLAVAAIGWLLVVLVALPASGEGWLGLSQGPTTPLVWAVLFAVYGALLDAGLGASAPFNPSRRRFLGWLGVVGLVAIGLVKLPGWLQILISPPEKSSGIVPALTPVQKFYVVSKNFQDPVVDAKGWALEVGGMAGTPYRLSYVQLRQLPATTLAITLECVSNPVGGNLISTGRFTGVRLRDLLTRARPHAGASGVDFRARDGFTESLSLPEAMASQDILVAYDLDGQALPNAHGFPARIVLPGHYGMRGPKWLDRITIVQSEGSGYWEEQGWDHQATVKTMSRIDAPAAGSLLRRSPTEVAGVAFAGNRGIQAVEWSADGGRSWSQAQLETPLSPLTWVRWTASWTPAQAGNHVLVVRARDGHGQLQPHDEAASFPSGASGWHTVAVQVG